MLALIFAALSLPVAAQDPTINYEQDDSAMNAAVAKAQATLPLFLANAPNAEGCASGMALVKVGFPTVDDSDTEVEHIWVAPFARRDDGSFTGLLANDPVALSDLAEGDQVEFDQAMISDWHLTAPSGRYWGSFTSRVMYDQGAFGDTPFDQIFEPEAVPADWK